LKKTLNLFGHECTFSASDEDYYLAGMAPGGPPDIQPVFEQFCHPGDVVIDVGSNIGITAVIAGLLVSPGSVLALEPVKETFEYLERNIEQSKSSNVKCLHLAASSTPGQVRLVSEPGYRFAAFVGYGDVLNRYSGYSEDVVTAITLDALVEDEGLSRVDFVKIDVEGFELEVLRGSALLLKRFQPTVFLEANHYCLNVFRRVSMVDFVEEILSTFPIVQAVDASLETLDLTVPRNLPGFFHANVVGGRYQNLLCGFRPSVETAVRHLRPVESTSSTPSVVPEDRTLGQSTNRLAARLRRRVTDLIPKRRV
jgi:FkbM family methyltransferase